MRVSPPSWAAYGYSLGYLRGATPGWERVCRGARRGEAMGFPGSDAPDHGGHRVHGHLFGNALQSVRAPVGIRESRAGDKFFEDAGHQHLTRASKSHHSGTDVYRHAANRSTSALRSPYMQAAAHLNAKLSGGIGDRTRTPNCELLISESREEAIPCRVYQRAAVSPHLPADEVVVSLQERPPASIPQLGRHFRRCDDVG